MEVVGGGQLAVPPLVSVCWLSAGGGGWAGWHGGRERLVVGAPISDRVPAGVGAEAPPPGCWSSTLGQSAAVCAAASKVRVEQTGHTPRPRPYTAGVVPSFFVLPVVCPLARGHAKLVPPPDTPVGPPPRPCTSTAAAGIRSSRERRVTRGHAAARAALRAAAGPLHRPLVVEPSCTRLCLSQGGGASRRGWLCSVQTLALPGASRRAVFDCRRSDRPALYLFFLFQFPAPLPHEA